MDQDAIERAMNGSKVSRRWLLRSAVNVTAGAVAASTTAAADLTPAPGPAETIAPDHDPLTGEIFDRARHHHWDTV